MKISNFTNLGLLAGLAAAQADGTYPISGHEQYSSSYGILGCYMNTDRAMYFPWAPTCSNFCKRVTLGSNSVIVAHIDTSSGHHDISFDAYNYLMTGQSSTYAPGGDTEMQVTTVDPAQCADIFTGGKVTFGAISGTNWLNQCINQGDNWVAKNYAVKNIYTTICTIGVDEDCTMDSLGYARCPTSFQVSAVAKLTTRPTFNRKYGTGEKYMAQ